MKYEKVTFREMLDLLIAICVIGGTVYGLMIKDYTILLMSLGTLLIDAFVCIITGTEFKEACNRERIIKHADKNRMFNERHIDEVVSHLCRENKYIAKELEKEIRTSIEKSSEKTSQEVVEQEVPVNNAELINSLFNAPAQQETKTETKTEVKAESIVRYLVDLSGEKIVLRDFETDQAVRSFEYEEVLEINTTNANKVVDVDNAWGIVELDNNTVITMYLGVAEVDFALEYNIANKDQIEKLVLANN